MLRFFSLYWVLVVAVGCQLYQPLTPMLPSQILGSEWGRQGIAAMEQGDITKAEERLEYAVKLNKNDINHRRHYAEILWQQGKHQESLQQLDEAVKRGGQNDASLHIALAQKYLAMDKYTAAYRDADEAVRLNPQSSQSLALRGRVKYQQAIYQGHSEQKTAMLHQAREDFLRAASLTPNDKDILSDLALAQMNCGQPEQALATWLTLERLYPPGEEPAGVLIGKVETLATLHRFDEAEEIFMAIQQRDGEKPESLRRLQEIMMANKSGSTLIPRASF